jgi:hypothetical protein
MRKDQVRSLTLGVSHPSARRTGTPETRLSLSVGSTLLHAQARPHCSPMKREECSAPIHPSSTDALARSFAQERNATPLFSHKRAPSRARSSQQLPHSQIVTDSLARATTLTPAFPVASPLFVRSWSTVQHSTLLLSWACALLGKSTREGGGARRRKLQPQLQLRPSSHAEVSYSEGLHSGPKSSPGISENTGCGLYLQPA